MKIRSEMPKPFGRRTVTMRTRTLTARESAAIQPMTVSAAPSHAGPAAVKKREKLPMHA